jgi:hypothetical protein
MFVRITTIGRTVSILAALASFNSCNLAKTDTSSGEVASSLDAEKEPTTARGAGISNSGEEVNYSYKVTFRSLLQQKEGSQTAVKDAATFHASHLFGLFHSPEVSEKSGYYPELIEGFAGTKSPQIVQVSSERRAGDPYLWVTYEAQSSMILLKSVAKKWLKSSMTGTTKLPLLIDLPKSYLDDQSDYRDQKWTKCTDDHYNTTVDFSYFYTPYKCRELRTKPIAQSVTFNVTRLRSPNDQDTTAVPLAKLRGDNGNGKIMTLYFVSGFNDHLNSSSSKEEIERDFGFKSYALIEKLLVKRMGFTSMDDKDQLRSVIGSDIEKIDLLNPVQLSRYDQRRFFSTYVKQMGDTTVVVRSALFSTELHVEDYASRSFPRFWKEAWENADFIYYGGHSGDGFPFDIRNLNSALKEFDLSTIRFKKSKSQIAVFDSCSSFAQYQPPYTAKNPANLHLVSMGLVSLFHLGPATVEQLLALVLSPSDTADPKWADALRTIEQSQLPLHVKFYYGQYKAAEEQKILADFKKSGQAPTSLMSVSVP